MKFRLILFAAISFAASAFAQTYYLPPGVTNIRAMIVGGTPLAGGTSQIWRDFCAAQRVGLVRAVTDMPTVATATGHPEVANAAFVTCGTSAGANAATSTAIANPTRAIAVVGLHGVMFALGNTGFNANRGGELNDVPTLDFSGAYGVPMIHNFDNNDGFVNPVVLQGLVEWGRAHGAPWTFFIHNDGTHTDNDTALTTLIFPWLAAVLDARLPANAGTGDGTVTLNAVPESSGWLGDIKMKTIASFASYTGDKTKADWFPNQSAATIWSGYHFAPPYSIPAQPVVAPSGIIADLTILDPANNDTSSGTGWKINANLKEADQTGSLVKYFIMAATPASVAGLDWIRPIQPGHNYSAYTADPIFTFRVTADATVVIAHSDQITARPAWLSSWTNTGEQMVITPGNLTASAPKHTLFKKDFAANAIVTCGSNGTGSGTMYLTAVKPLGTQALPSVSVSASIPNATEGGANGQFTVTRTGATTSALTVNFAVTGSATSGADYVSLGTGAVIPAGQSSVALAVTPIDDLLVEGTETVTLSISSSAAYALGAIITASVNITDNDTSSLPVVTVVANQPNAAEPSTSGQWTLSRTGSTTSALVVAFTTTGTAARAVDYTLTGPAGTNMTIPAGQSLAVITLNVINDSLVEGTETAIFNIAANANYTVGSPASATISIADDDSGSGLPMVTIVATNPNAAEPSTTGTFTVTRTGATTSALAVNYAISGTATNGTDYQTLNGSVSIAAGQASVAITVTPIDDALVEGTETVIATLSANAAYTLGSPSSATVNIADDDTSGTLPIITVTSTDAIASEGGSDTGNITITRSGSTTNALTVQLAYGGTAVNGADYTTRPSSVTIAAGASTATLTLTAIDDALVEGAEIAVISAAAGGGYTLGTPGYTSIRINDNDNAAPLITTGIVFATHVSGANTRDIKLNVYRPATGSGPWPVIIYFPGGGWTSQTEGSVPQFLLNFTASGYAVVSANYVTSSFAKWPAQIQDTKAAVRWVRANAATYGFDAMRIGLTGSSSGGHMTAYTGLTGGLKTARCGSEVIDLIGGIGGNLTQSDAVQAVAPFYPPTDLLAMDRYPTPDVPDHNGSSPETGLIGFPIQTVPEKTGTANPIIHVRAGVPPFWITQGTADRSVDFNQSELLNAALVNAGQPVTFWPAQGAGHGTGVIDNQEVFLLLRTFFDRTLKGIATNPLPVPTFTASALSGTAPLTVTFDGSASTAPAGAITKYSWSSGDDTGGGNATLTYTFTRAGVYPVTLAVQDDKGGTASITRKVVVTPAGSASATPPTISITSPADGAWYARTGDLSLQTTAAANGGANGGATIASVEFLLNGQPVAWDSKTPFALTLGQLAPGAYTATARVSDSTGAATFSAPVSFHVFGETDVFPLPSLSSGIFGASYFRFTDGTLAYTFERSDDLTTWTPFTPTQTILTNGAQIQLMQATDPLSATGVPRRFLRIKISPAP